MKFDAYTYMLSVTTVSRVAPAIGIGKDRAVDENPKARGGHARAAALTPEQRSESARNAAESRWENNLPRSTHEGPVRIGEIEIGAAVLPDGTRLLSQGAFLKAIGRSRSVPGGSGGSAGDQLPAFLQADRLGPYITDEMRDLATPVAYATKSGKRTFGYDARLLPMVCEVYLRYRDDLNGDVDRRYQRVVSACDLLMRGLARVGIIALVDESTGYQQVRDRIALQRILDAYLKHDLAAWSKRFPDEFYKQIFRLRGWELNSDMFSRRPGVVGKWTDEIVYSRLAPGILDELRERNPVTESGRRRGRHHQLLTDEIGHPALAQHIHTVITLMRISRSWPQFKRTLNEAFPMNGDQLALPITDDFEIIPPQ